MSRFVFSLLLLCCGAAHSAAFTAALGIDAWDATGDARYLPNYMPAKPWSNFEPWAIAKAEFELTPDLTATFQARAHALDGNRAQRADLNWRISDEYGVRVGMLPYRVSWCRDLGEGPWIKEPDALCRQKQLAEITEGSAGIQAYRSGAVGSWVVDAMAGVYQPMIDGQDKDFGVFIPVGPTVSHDKWGASINAVQAQSGAEIRAGFLRTDMQQDYDDSRYKDFRQHMRYDMTYLGANIPAGSAIFRASWARYAGYQDNVVPYSWFADSKTLEVSFPQPTGHIYAVGLSEYTHNAMYPTFDQPLKVVSANFVFHRDLGPWAIHWQATRSIDTATIHGVSSTRASNAYGLRVVRFY